MTDIPQDDALFGYIMQHLLSQAATGNDAWTEEDALIFQHLREAIAAARRKGYSEADLQQVLHGLFLS